MKTYKSVPVIASIIGTRTRKSMYIYHVTSLDGEIVYQNRYIPVAWGSGDKRTTIEWERTSDEFVQFPLTLARPIMIIPKADAIGCTNICRKRVNGVVQDYFEITQRHIIYIPLWLFLPQKDSQSGGFKTMFTKLKPSIASQEDEQLYKNDDSPYTMAEDADYKAEQEESLAYRPSADVMLTGLEIENDGLAQWEIDHPEYSMDKNLLFN